MLKVETIYLGKWGSLKDILVDIRNRKVQWADILTKPLSTTRFIYLRDKLRVSDKLALGQSPSVWTGAIRKYSLGILANVPRLSLTDSELALQVVRLIGSASC